MEFGPKHLFTIAEHLGAHEIVVPDVLADVEDTLARALSFSRFVRPEFRYMAVLQGRNWNEVMKCLKAYVDLAPLNYITCIGIPRLLTYDDKAFRVRVAEYIQENNLHATLEFHVLGAQRWIEEPKELKNYECLRGMDTSLPVYMGLEGFSLKDEYFSRPENFFERSAKNQTAFKNCMNYIAWAQHDNTYVPEKAS